MGPAAARRAAFNPFRRTIDLSVRHSPDNCGSAQDAQGL